MRITLFDLEPWEEKLAKAQLKKHKLKFLSHELRPSDIPKIKDTEILVTFIEPDITKKIIDALPNLKLICTMSTGFDHIDVSYAKSKKIKVSNVPTYGQNTVAEHAFALILTLSRKIYPSIKTTHEKKSFETSSDLKGFDLKDKTIGIIGHGNIGKHVERIALGFGMKVLINDRHPGKTRVPLKTLMKKSDVITLHVPYLPSTRHLISKSELKLMKPSAIIINTSRGPILDTTALLPLLKKNKIAGAALDVLEEEEEIKEHHCRLKKGFKRKACQTTLLENNRLMSLDNVIITPHNAFNTQEALERILNTTLDNIKSFSKGNPKNSV